MRRVFRRGGSRMRKISRASGNPAKIKRMLKGVCVAVPPEEFVKKPKSVTSDANFYSSSRRRPQGRTRSPKSGNPGVSCACPGPPLSGGDDSKASEAEHKQHRRVLHVFERRRFAQEVPGLNVPANQHRDILLAVDRIGHRRRRAERAGVETPQRLQCLIV